ncbi:hypothetical protein LP420_01770 [Massilia sp. B-10]|nr:hypothetical protein LP420_01770 [Massilia sp. B-10]
MLLLSYAYPTTPAHRYCQHRQNAGRAGQRIHCRLSTEPDAAAAFLKEQDAAAIAAHVVA